MQELVTVNTTMTDTTSSTDSESIMSNEVVKKLEEKIAVNRMSANTHLKYDYYVPKGMGLCMDEEFACAETAEKIFSYSASSNFLTSATVAVAAFVMQATWKVMSFVGTVLGRLFTFKPVNMEVGFTDEGPRIMFMLNADKLAAKGLPEHK